MAQYTVQAFQWSGTHYNAQYDTSVSATFNDNDGAYQGSDDSDETISIDGGSFNGTSGPAYTIDVSFTATDGGQHVESFEFFNTGGDWYFVPGPDSEFTEGATLGSYQSHTVGWNYSDVTCFTRGTRISTHRGDVPVEKLRCGDLVETVNGDRFPLRLVLRKRISGWELWNNPSLAPVCITAGALGGGLPKRDLRVSRQHRQLITSKVAERMFGCKDVLIAAAHLTHMPGIFADINVAEMEYFHLIFDQHAVIYAEGAPSESFYLGAQAMSQLSSEALSEVATLFPDLLSLEQTCLPAQYIPSGRRQKRLVERMASNGRAMIEQ